MNGETNKMDIEEYLDKNKKPKQSISNNGYLFGGFDYNLKDYGYLDRNKDFKPIKKRQIISKYDIELLKYIIEMEKDK